jgi:Protein of unknown function (DUF3592)
MRYLLWFMLGSFALAGAYVILSGLRRLWTMAIRRGLLVKAVGTVTSIEKKQVHMSHSHMSHARANRYSFIPTIAFTTATGDALEFRSEVGDLAARSSYQIGQKIDVLYDPTGILPPMIDTWFARWGMHILMVFSGFLFLGGAGLVYWILGQPAFATP